MSKKIVYASFFLFAVFLSRYVFYDMILVALYRPTGNEFEGKFVVVTGASAGIGRATAKQFCERGANIIITARSKTKLEEVKKHCSQRGNNNVHVVTGDMNKTEDIADIVKFVKKTHVSGIDHLILNHIAPYKIGHYSGDMDYLRLSVQLNYLSYVDMTQNLLAAVRKRSGQILVISSLAAKIPFPITLEYAATKHALDGFYGALRSEIERHYTDMKVTLVHFGPVATDSAINIAKRKKDDESLKYSQYIFLSEEDSSDVVLTAALVRPNDLYSSIFRLVDLILPFCEDLFFDFTFNRLLTPGGKLGDTWNSDVLGE